MPFENSLWHRGIGIFNLSRCYSKKIKVPRFPLATFQFSVLLFQFLLFIIKLLVRLELPKLLFLWHYILVMYPFNLHHLLLLRSGDTKINPGPKKSSSLIFVTGISVIFFAHDFVNPNKAELFEGSFSWGMGRGVNLTLPHSFIFQEELI